mmetsp:Transcript_2478/g.7735  ORF Transcript_2478/g.7735 Transcript_2478/m.7735 type:complete len:239 (-) Transcript_2478:56-772(-)
MLELRRRGDGVGREEVEEGASRRAREAEHPDLQRRGPKREELRPRAAREAVEVDADVDAVRRDPSRDRGAVARGDVHEVLCCRLDRGARLGPVALAQRVAEHLEAAAVVEGKEPSCQVCQRMVQRPPGGRRGLRLAATASAAAACACASRRTSGSSSGTAKASKGCSAGQAPSSSWRTRLARTETSVASRLDQSQMEDCALARLQSAAGKSACSASAARKWRTAAPTRPEAWCARAAW